MGSNASSLAFVAAVVLGSGCAKRTDEEVRAAWGQSDDAPDPESPDAETPRTEGRRRPGGRPGRKGWSRVDQVLVQATNLLATSPDPEVVAELATRWCETEPAPVITDHGEVRICAPTPPVTIDDTAFVLEMATVGVIGLVATDLEADASAELAQAARLEVERMCERPWTESQDHAFFTCPVLGGSTLAVGRVPSDKRGSAWQVSIAVLGAS